jgi:hypothetical protein
MMKQQVYFFIVMAFISVSCNNEKKDLATTLATDNLEAYRQFLINYPRSGSVSEIRDSIVAKEKKLWPPLPVFPDTPDMQIIFYAMRHDSAMGRKIRNSQPAWKWNVFSQIENWKLTENDILELNDELRTDFEDVSHKPVHFMGKALHARRLEDKDQKTRYRVNWDQFSLFPANGPRIDLTACYEDGKLVGFKYDSSAVAGLKPGDEMVIYDKYGWRTVTIEDPLKSDKLDIKDLIFREHKTDSTASYKIVRALVLFASYDGTTALAWDDGEIK